MTDADIREFFDLDETADLDRPVANLGFESYREVAQAQFEKWGTL
jgi:hypothetical protein